MKIKLKTFPVFLCILICLLLSSCYDAAEVEETAYVIALGIDKGSNGGNIYTFQIAAPLGSSGSEEIGAFSDSGSENGDENTEEDIMTADNKTVKNTVISAEDFYTARTLLANYMSKNISLAHLKMIIISDETANEIMAEHFEIFSSERQIRPATFIAVSKGRAEEYLKCVNPELEASTAKYYELSNTEKMLFYAPAKGLGSFMNDMKTFDKSGVLPLAVISKSRKSAELDLSFSSEDGIKRRLSSSKTEMFGMGIFKDKHLVAVTGGEEALIYNVLCGQTESLIFSCDAENGKKLFLKADFLKKPCFKISEKNGSLQIDVDIFINLKYCGTESKSKKSLELGENALKEKISRFLYLTSSEYNADILKLEKIAGRKYKTAGDAKNSDFEKKYKDCLFNVSVKTNNKIGSGIV